jgi:hypothetical protein
MGILGVSLSPFEGENPAEAMKRVLNEVDKQNKRIEETRGGLLVDAYR